MTFICFRYALNLLLGINKLFFLFQRQCRYLFCPFGSTAYNGKCENIALQTRGLAIEINYSIQVLTNLSHICQDEFEKLDKNSLGKAIKTKFVKILGVRKGVCPVCGYGVWIVENSQQVVPTEFIFSTKLVTDFDCQLDSIYNIATGIVVKEMKIVLGDCLNFKTIYRLDTRVKYPPNMRRIYYNMRSCRSIYRVDREVICPEVEIAASDRISIIGKSKHANLHALFRTEKELDNNTITVCLERLCICHVTDIPAIIIIITNSKSSIENNATASCVWCKRSRNFCTLKESSIQGKHAQWRISSEVAHLWSFDKVIYSTGFPKL